MSELAEENKNKFWNIAAAILVAAVLFFLERIVSGWLLGKMSGDAEIIFIDKIVFFRASPNSAWAFSLPAPKIFIYAISAVGLAAAAFVYVKYFCRERTAGFAFALILSGAASNLWSRATAGFVWDWLNIRLLGMTGSWNLADAMVLSGMLAWLWVIAREK
jgi:lipoprotein signal peptidase